jgi:hypothetical protein
MLDPELSHREILRIASRQRPIVHPRRGCDQTIALIQRHAASGKGTPPSARLPRSPGVYRQHNESAEQPACCLGLGGTEATHYLLDIDRSRRRHVTGGAQRHDVFHRWSPPEEVDQHSGVKNAKHRSPSATGVGAALLPHPSRRVGIPLVILILDDARCCFDVGPSEFLANCTLNGRTHKCAATSRTAEFVDLSDELIVQFYVHSHVQSLAHLLNLTASGGMQAE